MRETERVLIALSSACAAAVIGYASLRIFEHAFFPEPNPVILIWSERSGFFWRSLLSLYVGGLGAFGGYALAARAPHAVGRWLTIAIGAAAITIVLQGALLP